MDKKKTYKYLILTLKDEYVHLLNEINHVAMSEFGCDGVEEFSLIETQVDTILGERAYSGGDIPEDLLDEVDQVVKADAKSSYKYFFYEGDIETNIDNFQSFLADNSAQYDFKIEAFEEEWEDWNTNWREHYKIVHISDEMQIVPEWFKEKFKDQDHKNIYIYPGMGFGTGEHETTSLCLEIFDKIKDQYTYKSCLDFGCGSGILGIAAIKFSSMATVFCDIDKSALDNTVQNLDLNFPGQDLSAHKLVIRERFESTKNEYQLVFANILEHVLVLEKSEILNSLSKDGSLIVSGLLNAQVDNIIREYSDKLKMMEVLSRGDWSAILFKRI